jgi:hypothetical protein
MSVKENKLRQKIEISVEKSDTDFNPIITFVKTIAEMNGQKVEGTIESFNIEASTDWCSKQIERININIKTVTEDRLCLLDSKTIEIKGK